MPSSKGNFIRQHRWVQELDHPHCRNMVITVLAETLTLSHHFPGTVQEFPWDKTHPDRQPDAAILVWRLKGFNNSNVGYLASGPGKLCQSDFIYYLRHRVKGVIF